jgi:hypothetical protein
MLAIIVYVCMTNLNHFQLQEENRRCLRIAMEATVSIFGDLKKKACAAGSHDFSEPFPHLQPSPPDACAYTCVCVCVCSGNVMQHHRGERKIESD